MAVRVKQIQMNSLVKYRSEEGFQNLFPFVFPVPKGSEIQVLLGLSIQEPTTDYKIIKHNGVDTVEFTVDVPIDTYVTIRRVTPTDGLPHTYSFTGNAKGGAEFNAKTIDENFMYTSRIVEEASDNMAVLQDLVDSNTDEVIKIAEEAKQIAIQAQGEVQEVIAKADEALEEALKVVEVARDARELAQQANDNIQEAIIKADEASAKADSVQGIANSALSTAQQADSKVDGAVLLAQQAGTKADNALAEATNAKGIATSAQTTADQALAKANTMPSVLQVTGQSTSGVMSQKTTTDELNKRRDKADIKFPNQGFHIGEGAQYFTEIRALLPADSYNFTLVHVGEGTAIGRHMFDVREYGTVATREWARANIGGSGGADGGTILGAEQSKIGGSQTVSSPDEFIKLFQEVPPNSVVTRSSATTGNALVLHYRPIVRL